MSRTIRVFLKSSALALVMVVACTPGAADPTGAAGAGGQTTGLAGTGGPAGSGGSTGQAGTGVAGAGGCVTPPIVQVSWTFMPDATSTQRLSCTQVNAKYIEFFMDTAHTQFPCSPQNGMSTDFLPGKYTPRIFLLDNNNQVIFQGTSPNQFTVPTCGVTSIGNFSIVVPPTGAAGAGGSSGAAGAGGSTGAAGAGGHGGAAGGTAGAGGSGAGGAGGGTGPCNALPIFGIHTCATMACHDANGSSANFNMATPGWEKTLVGRMPKTGGAAGLQTQCGAAGMPYLVAGSSPAKGLFLDKLFSTKPVCGAQMPLLPPTLTPTEMDCVQRWANGLTKP
jgi:hypothetical protein